MTELLKILYRPKSILGLCVAVGLGFLLIGGLAIEISEPVSNFFIHWGKILVFLGFIGWLLYALPSIIRNWSRLGK